MILLKRQRRRRENLMTMPSLSSGTLRTSLSALCLLSAGAFLHAQPTKIPTVDEIKAVQSKYRAERDKIVKDGTAKRFLPVLMDKAEEIAKKSDTALGAGRLLQASEAIRQARWQLPYQPVGVPDNVSRIIGNLRLRHSREINALAFSPDGLKLASASSDATVKIWDLGNGHEILTYDGHKDKVRCLAWSGDGTFIVSAGMEKNIKVWNPSTGKTEQTIAATGEFVSSIALSRDGKHVFTGQINVPGNPTNGLFVYETKSGKLIRDLRDFPNRIGTMSLNSEGSILAAGDDNGNVRLFHYPSFVENANQPAYWTQQDPTGATYHVSFSPDDKTLVRTGPLGVKLYTTPLRDAPFQVGAPRLAINTNGTRCAVYSKDGKTIFTGGFDGNIQFWDADNAQKVGEFKNAHTSPINALTFTPEGNRLASCSGDFTVRLWDFDVVLQARDFEGHESPVWTASFSRDGTKIVSASADRTVKVWQRDTGNVLFTLDHTAPVAIALFSPDGKLIASAGGDKLVHIWDATTGKLLRTCEGHQGTITFLDFSHDSKRIVSGGIDRHIKIWDADNAKQMRSINDNPSIVSGVAFSPDGKQIAVANVDQTIRLYDALSGKLQHSWNAHGTAANGVAYSPNGQLLASCGADMAVQIWPLATPGTNSIRLTGHTGPVSSVAFRMDNVHLVSCGADQLIKLWKIEGNAGKEVQTFRGHKDWVTSVAFSKDGFHVVSSSVDRRVKIWEITSRELPLLAEHSSAVQAVAVSPDGNIIATGSVDRTIKLWDRKTGVELATLTGHTGAVMSLIFTPDGKRIISAGTGGSASRDAIRLWEVTPPREIARSQQQLATMSGLRMKGYSPYIAVDPEGKTLFVWIPGEGNVKTIVEVHDWLNGTIRYEITEQNLVINSFAFCANGKMCAAGGRNGSVRIWDLGKNGAKIVPDGDWILFNKDKGKVGVADLALTPDGSLLIATSDDGEIKIGKLQGREILKSFKGHKSGISACIVSPDGKYFATVDSDNVVKAWSIDGTELRSWDLGKHHGMFIINLAFSADSKQIITANANTTVYVLDLP
jgi:WD40 repeat protein